MAALGPLPSCEVTAAFTRLGFAITGDRGPAIELTRLADGVQVTIPNTDPVPPAALRDAFTTAGVAEADFLEAL